MRVAIAIFFWQCSASKVAPEAGMNTNAKGKSVRRDTIGETPMRIKLIRIIAKEILLTVRRFQIDYDTITRLDNVAIRQMKRALGRSPGNGTCRM
jgi:hypothetical protein